MIIDSREQHTRKRLLNDDQEKWLCCMLCSNPGSTQRMIQHIACDRFNMHISQAYVSRMLYRHNITRKKATKHFAEQDVHAVQQFLSSLPPEAGTWLALDECSFVLNNAPSYAYSKKGSRAVVTRPGPRGQRFSLILCIAASGYVAYSWHCGSIKSAEFAEFMSRLPEDSTIVMDNASTHHAGIISSIARARRQNHVFLPPYSPQLNPTELCFNVLKGIVRRQRITKSEDLFAEVDSTLKSLEISGFFRHCWT